MRALFLTPLLLPLPALADDIPVTSRVTAVTAYPGDFGGGTVTREGTFTLPAGQHQLILQDTPHIGQTGLRVEVTGATMGSVTVRDDYLPPRSDSDSDALRAAEDEVERLEALLRTRRDAIAAIEAEAEAARDRIAFLTKLGEGDNVLAAGLDNLRDLSRMIGEETLEARRTAQQAEIRARAAEEDLKDLREELKKARQAVAALDTEREKRAWIAVNVDAEAETEATITIRYVSEQIGWTPVYDLHLDRKPQPTLTIGRGAYIGQSTGENWQDVALTLSTVRPSGQTDPGELWPMLRRIGEPPSEKTEGYGADMAVRAAPAPVTEPAMVAEETAQASFDGLSVTYSYDRPLSLASDADTLRIALGEITMSPELQALAIPMLNQQAFLMAHAENGTEELLLPTGASEFYLDGTYVGTRATPLIAAGDEIDLSFGPIEGIRLERTVLDRNEGDRGVISRSNELAERVEIEIRNLTGEAWDLRLLDQIPYSEQEDLTIRSTATPQPTERDVDGKRGVLAWDMDLAPGDTRTVRLDHTMTWPSDKVLFPDYRPFR